MTTPKQTSDFITLAEQDGLGAFQVSVSGYEQLVTTMDAQLEKLVLLWKTCAAPQANARSVRSSDTEDLPHNA